jgi:Lsr2
VARQLIEQITDDLDGTKADRSVRFSLDDVNYEIDLSRKNAAAFAKAMKPYTDAARRVRPTTRGGRRSRTGSGTSRRNVESDLAAIREWAKQHGHAVAERGRIPAVVLAAYAAR